MKQNNKDSKSNINKIQQALKKQKKVKMKIILNFSIIIY